jgi:hypothetical protein
MNQAPSVSLSGVWMRTFWVLKAVVRPMKMTRGKVRSLAELVKGYHLTSKIIFLRHVILREERASEVVHKEESKEQASHDQ